MLVAELRKRCRPVFIAQRQQAEARRHPSLTTCCKCCSMRYEDTGEPMTPDRYR
jgi:hypothetical protein